MSEPVWVPLGGEPAAPAAPVPAGALLPYAGAAAPTGYLLCDGTAVSRTTYADLFTAIGTTFGVGDGSTTFNLPDLRGRVPVGKGTHADVDALGDSDGMATVANRRPKHRHTPHSHTTQTYTGAGSTGLIGDLRLSAGPTPATSAVDGGSGVATDSLDAPAYLTLNFIIKT